MTGSSSGQTTLMMASAMAFFSPVRSTLRAIERGNKFIPGRHIPTRQAPEIVQIGILCFGGLCFLGHDFFVLGDRGCRRPFGLALLAPPASPAAARGLFLGLVAGFFPRRAGSSRSRFRRIALCGPCRLRPTPAAGVRRLPPLPP